MKVKIINVDANGSRLVLTFENVQAVEQRLWNGKREVTIENTIIDSQIPSDSILLRTKKNVTRCYLHKTEVLSVSID